MKKLSTLIVLLTLGLGGAVAQKKGKNQPIDWSKVDFANKYKISVKIPGATGKSLGKDKTFVSYYSINQATVMKGSERSATKSVFSEVQFGGVDQAAFQQMVNECYKDFVDQLSAAGLDITNGDELMATDYAQDIMNNGKKNDFAGKSPGKPFETKKRIDEGGIAGYGVWSVTRGLNFQPENVNELTTSRRILGNFYNKFIQKEHVNLIQVSYNITFASFDGGRGYKDVSLATKPLLSVNPQVAIYSASGWPTVEMKKGPVFGNDGWSVGLEKIKDNQDDAFLLGLARSADYVLTVDPGKYLPEIKDIIMNYQKALVAEIKSKVK